MNVYEPIAVIGLACRFPDAPNIETFKKNLVQGHDAIRPMSAEDMQREGINPDLLTDPNFVNAGTLINNPANFDCAFFGLSPKEAELMDPQHRLFLEESRKLLDVANLSRGPLNIGIYAGCRQSTYQMMLPPIQPENITQTDCFQQLMGNDKDYLATRIAYQLNLTGPAMSLQTACSTSLVTVHQACQALRNNECDAALAGGVGISFPQGVGYKASPGMIFSNDGKCRPFSADGSGIVAGNGLGIIALKRLKDAIKDGDTVHAVIKGSALSNDGKAKLGFTAPGKTGQQKAIKLALANSGINPNQVGLLEAHGTGTPLGDPIEVQAISEIYRSAGVPKQACAIGSVKGNVGHLDTAAGIASLIKAILSVRDDILPPTLHCKPSNPNIAFETSPFYLVTEQQAWPKSFKDRIAAVSSFGIGGTNCHMLVQQAPTTLSSEKPSNEEADRTHILAVSNHCKDNVSTQINHCISATQPELLAAQCRTLAIKRQHYPSRIAVVGKDKSSLQQALSAASIRTVKANPKTVWVFSGQGSQITGMGKTFYSSHCVFKEAIDLCCRLFATEGINHLTQIMFESSFAEQLDKTYYTQPALFTWQYAMAKLLLSWGIKPNVVVGHSIGEFAASVVSGHVVLESAIRLVAHRASLMQNNVQHGSMLAIRCSEEYVNNVLRKHRNVCIAAHNNEERFTLSGPEESINNLLKTLTQEEIPHQLLSVQRAFHSSAMEQIKEPFLNHSIPLNSTSAHTTMYSTLTAKTVEKGGLDNNYWFQQLRQPVLFHQAITALSAEHPDVVIEIGPDGSFSQLLRNQQSLNQTSQISKTSQPSIAALVAELYSLGYNTPLEEYYAEANRHSRSYAQMPAIEFSPTRCWPDNPVNVSRSASQSNGPSQTNELDETIARCNDTQLWQWKWLALPPLYQQNLQKINKISDEKWCLVGDHDFSQTLASFIESSGHQCVICEEPPHTRYDRIIDTRLLKITLSPDKSIESLESAANQLVNWGRYAESYPECQIITLVSNASHLDNPQQGNLLWPLLNLCRTYANEKPHLSHCCLDITDSPLTEGFVSKLQQVIELGTVLLLKNDSLYSLTVDSQSIAFPENPCETPSDHHTLIAGLGTVGLGLAQWLADRGCQKLAFLIRRAPNSKQQKIIDKLSSRGISIHVINADLTSKAALSTAFDPLNISIDRVFHTAHSGIEKLHPLEDIEAFSGSLPVKIQGSVNLYQLLKAQPLKLYCMFSSATSVMAMPGASGYATANAWQDAYSAYLRSNGVKAVTVSWGQLALSKEAEHITQVDKTGITALNSDQAFSIMTYLINNDISGASPIIFDPVTLGRTLEILPATYPCLKPILRLEGTEKKQQTLDLQTIATFTDKQKEQAISEYIHQLISDKLKFKYHQLNPEQSLTEQGVDSLVFLELVQIINQQLKLSLPSTVGYEFGTIHSLAAHITSQLTHDDIAFCEQKAKSQMAIVPDPSNRYEPFPLTDLQQAFWIGRLDGLSLGSVSCHQYVELELDNLDCARLESAWNTLIQRHELMRCVILPSGQNQIIQHVDHYSVEHRDLTQLTKEQRAEKLESIRKRMSFQVFNPEVWPLFELSVSQLPENKSRVHLDIDLLIFDIQSFRIIYAELAALLENEHTQFPELELSFRDYILAEKKLEESADWLEAKAFWMDRLATIPNAPQLPVINSLNTNEPTTYRTLDHRLSPSLWQQLRKFASKFALTPSSVLLTAYTQALALYSKSAEFTLNITYFNRKNVHEQIMDVCGDFTSLMLLPVASHANQQFAGEAKRIQNDLWDALKHRDFNGIRVMRELGRHKESGADKIEMPVVFTSMIGMDFDDPSRPDWPLMSKQVFEINQTPQVWIDYQASEYGGALMTRWFIADNLFEDQIIEGVFSTYTQFLEQLANQESQWQTFAPDLRSQQDRHIYKLLIEHQPIDDSLLMPQLLQRQVKALPDSPALIYQNSVIDYRTLGVQVNTLAHYLIKQGLPPSSPVIVLMPKQALSLVAAFAIQSAGGCYVPVNSEYDNDRLQTIISELSPFAILTVGQQISAAHQCPVIDLKQLDLTPYDVTPPHARQTPDELAYIIYTSGSTGHPKGVMLNHSMPINTLTALSKKLSITDKDRTLSLCACHHDMSIFDSYGIMTNGGSVIFPDADKLYDPEHWLSLIAAHQPTIINAVPSFISLLLDALESKPRELQPPRHIMMGGDWIPISLVNRINTLWPACKVQSIGGPTETAIVSAYYPVTTIDPTWSSIPYGKPLSNQSCYILSPDGRDCPIGIPGEICTGGMALSLGYWQDDTLTNKRYKTHPTQGVPIFHTGDLGCIGKDGNIEILGRMDSQINHNGLRIEPGEIEAAINQYQSISEAVVIYAGQPRKQLQGFITKTTNSIRHEGVSNAWIPANNTAHSACLDLPKGFNLDHYAARFAKMEQLSIWVMLATIQQVGLLAKPQQTSSTLEILKALNVAPHYQKILMSWIDALVAEGFILKGDDQSFTATHKVVETQNLEQLRQEITQQLADSSTSAEQRLWSLYTRCIDKIDQLLTGDFNPLSLMFEDGKTDFAESHYRENIVSQHFNHVAGKTANALLQAKSLSSDLRILEFGAGIGSVTHDILKNVPTQNFSYDFTDISPYFLDNAKEMFKDWPQMRYSQFNINQEPGIQQLQLGTYDLIIGANVLHDAINVHTSIAYLRRLLKPDGHLMLVEGTLNPKFQMVSLGFVEGLSHYEDERLETHLPMISAPLWKSHLKRAGFRESASFPPQNHDVEKMNYHVIIAENNGEESHLDRADLNQWLRQKLPEYMLPTQWHHLDKMPLSLNGKTDRVAMAKVLDNQKAMQSSVNIPLQSEHSRTLASIWQDILNTEVSSDDANFFSLGGDSLLMTRLSNKIQNHYRFSPDLVTLLRHPILSEQAKLIETALLSTPRAADESCDFEEGII